MRDEVYGTHKSSILGLDANMVALLTYFASMIMGWIPVIRYVSFFAPLLIYLFEKNSAFVKFHAMQSFLLNIMVNVCTIIYALIAGISGVGIALGGIGSGLSAVGFVLIFTIILIVFSIAVFIFTIIAAVKAAQYKEYHMPVIGGWAARISGTE